MSIQITSNLILDPSFSKNPSKPNKCLTKGVTPFSKSLETITLRTISKQFLINEERRKELISVCCYFPPSRKSDGMKSELERNPKHH